MLGHLFGTVNRQRRRTEMFGYSMETVDRQRGDTETFSTDMSGDCFDTVDR